MTSPSAQPRPVDKEPDEPMHSHKDISGSDSESGSDDESGEDEQVEWLVTGREKRATAGNRLSTLVQQAAAEDDDLNLLFQEDDEDEGFEVEDEDGSDVQMDSSDDDDDQGPATAETEELEGEKELQRQARQAKKRKANDGIPRSFRKKVKIDPTAPIVPRPKKKSERASWIPTQEEGPTRASARRTTKESKEQLHAQMMNREKKRLKQLASMEKAAAKKAADAPKKLTQEDRLAQAARIEKQNAKSLNRWEEAEKAREEEQRLKLEALHNRKLEGPYISWWSGMAEWVNGKLKRVGKILIEDKPKTTAIYNTKKRKAAEMEAAEAEAAAAAGNPNKAQYLVPGVHYKLLPYASVAAHSIPLLQPNIQLSTTTTPPPRTDTATSDQLKSTPSINKTAPPPQAPSNTVQQQPLADSSPFPRTSNAPVVNSANSGPTSLLSPPSNMVPSPDIPYTFAPAQPPPTVPPPAVDVPPVIEHSIRNCIIFENFDETQINDKAVQTKILFGTNTAKIPKVYKTQKSVSKDLVCAITGYPAKFRDPSTGLAYCNAYAYKEIQKLKRGDYRWSSLLQAYVGQSTYAARGVPARFMARGT